MNQGGVLKNAKSKFNGKKFIGTQEIVNQLRKNGAKNPIIIQGLHASFKDITNKVSDPLKKIIYSAHPFFVNPKQNTTTWDENFGFFAQNNPFIITAWNATNHDDWCETSGIHSIADFLTYLDKRKIGLSVYAFDVPHSITRNFQLSFDTPSPSTDKCSPWGGAGELVQQYFNK